MRALLRGRYNVSASHNLRAHMHIDYNFKLYTTHTHTHTHLYTKLYLPNLYDDYICAYTCTVNLQTYIHMHIKYLAFMRCFCRLSGPH